MCWQAQQTYRVDGHLEGDETPAIYLDLLGVPCVEGLGRTDQAKPVAHKVQKSQTAAAAVGPLPPRVRYGAGRRRAAAAVAAARQPPDEDLAHGRLDQTVRVTRQGLRAACRSRQRSVVLRRPAHSLSCRSIILLSCVQRRTQENSIIEPAPDTGKQYNRSCSDQHTHFLAGRGDDGASAAHALCRVKRVK
eukprot:SAG31_NODE_104_length_25069_cov_12.917144_17_plen_191_part_00